MGVRSGNVALCAYWSHEPTVPLHETLPEGNRTLAKNFNTIGMDLEVASCGSGA